LSDPNIGTLHPTPRELPLMMGTDLLAYLVSQRLFGTRLPPILRPLLAWLLVAALTGQLGDFPSSFALPSLDVLGPAFSLAAIATAPPVLVALLTVQTNSLSAHLAGGVTK
jgi:predicted benzoate:H+ symporter BenE